MSGRKALVDFPTRGDVCLDNCFTNRPGLFNKCHSFQLSIKTDHTAVILLAGTKLKPICCKVLIWDCRENRKAVLYTALAEENWDNVLDAPYVQQVVCLLEGKIHGHVEGSRKIGGSLWLPLQVGGHGGKELMNYRNGVVHLNWGNFQRKEGGEFMRNYRQISLATGSY